MSIAPVSITASVLERCRFSVATYYAFSLYIPYAVIGFANRELPRARFRPQLDIWAARWVDAVDYATVVLLILGATVIGSVVAALLPWLRWGRALFFLGFFFFQAVRYDLQGQIRHGMHPWLWTAFVLIFLPPYELARSDVAARRAFANVVWAVQAIVLLSYTCSGISKLVTALSQLAAGEIGWVSPGGLTLLVQSFADPSSVGGRLVLAYPSLAYAGQLGVLYLELFAIVAAFRPRLQRPWAVGLVGLHLGVQMTLGITMPLGPIWAVLFLWRTPFARDDHWLWTVYDLPGFGRILAALALRIIAWRRPEAVRVFAEVADEARLARLRAQAFALPVSFEACPGARQSTTRVLVGDSAVSLSGAAADRLLRAQRRGLPGAVGALALQLPLLELRRSLAGDDGVAAEGSR